MLIYDYRHKAITLKNNILLLTTFKINIYQYFIINPTVMIVLSNGI